MLELHVHHPVQWFAYPAGKFDARTEALVRQAGYVLAVTTQPGSTQDARAPFALHRYEVLGMCKIAAIIALGYHLFRSGRATDKRFELWGAVVPPYLEEAARRLK